MKSTNMKFRKKPIVIDATQWFANGDHPLDGPYTKEGLVVRYFRRPDISGESMCSECGEVFSRHGWIDTLEDGNRVCPGDWIITGIKGEHYPCKPDIFEQTYIAMQEVGMNPEEQFERWYSETWKPYEPRVTSEENTRAITKRAFLDAFRLGHQQGMTRAAEIAENVHHCPECGGNPYISNAILTERDKEEK